MDDDAQALVGGNQMSPELNQLQTVLSGVQSTQSYIYNALEDAGKAPSAILSGVIEEYKNAVSLITSARRGDDVSKDEIIQAADAVIAANDQAKQAFEASVGSNFDFDKEISTNNTPFVNHNDAWSNAYTNDTTYKDAVKHGDGVISNGMVGYITTGQKYSSHEGEKIIIPGLISTPVIPTTDRSANRIEATKTIRDPKDRPGYGSPTASRAGITDAKDHSGYGPKTESKTTFADHLESQYYSSKLNKDQDVATKARINGLTFAANRDQEDAIKARMNGLAVQKNKNFDVVSARYRGLAEKEYEEKYSAVEKVEIEKNQRDKERFERSNNAMGARYQAQAEQNARDKENAVVAARYTSRAEQDYKKQQNDILAARVENQNKIDSLKARTNVYNQIVKEDREFNFAVIKEIEKNAALYLNNGVAKDPNNPAHIKAQEDLANWTRFVTDKSARDAVIAEQKKNNPMSARIDARIKEDRINNIIASEKKRDEAYSARLAGNDNSKLNGVLNINNHPNQEQQRAQGLAKVEAQKQTIEISSRISGLEAQAQKSQDEATKARISGLAAQASMREQEAATKARMSGLAAQAKVEQEKKNADMLAASHAARIKADNERTENARLAGLTAAAEQKRIQDAANAAAAASAKAAQEEAGARYAAQAAATYAAEQKRIQDNNAMAAALRAKAEAGAFTAQEQAQMAAAIRAEAARDAARAAAYVPPNPDYNPAFVHPTLNPTGSIAKQNDLNKFFAAIEAQNQQKAAYAARMQAPIVPPPKASTSPIYVPGSTRRGGSGTARYM